MNSGDGVTDLISEFKNELIKKQQLQAQPQPAIITSSSSSSGGTAIPSPPRSHTSSSPQFSRGGIQVDTNTASMGLENASFRSASNGTSNAFLAQYNKTLVEFGIVPGVAGEQRDAHNAVHFTSSVSTLSKERLFMLFCAVDNLVWENNIQVGAANAAAMDTRTPTSRRHHSNNVQSFNIPLQPSSQQASLVPGPYDGQPYSSNDTVETTQSSVKSLNIPDPTITTRAEEIMEDGWTCINGYMMLESLGRGSYGSVFLASTPDGDPVAVKTVSKAKLTSASDHMIRSEIAVMKKLKHRNIVQLKEVIDDPSSNLLYMVMQYVDRGELLISAPTGTKHVPHFMSIDPDIARSYMKQLIDAVRYTHRRGVAHRDIKPSNVLLSSEGRVYLADFGVSHIFDRKEDTQVSISAGTPAFMAPEVYSGNEYDAKAADVWALGATFYTMIYGRFPFNGSTHFEYRDSIIQTEPPYPSYGDDDGDWGTVQLSDVQLQSDTSTNNSNASRRRSSLISNNSSLSPTASSAPTASPRDTREHRDAIDLIRKMLDKNPATRVNINQCAEHPFVATKTRISRDMNQLDGSAVVEELAPVETEVAEAYSKVLPGVSVRPQVPSQ